MNLYTRVLLSSNITPCPKYLGMSEVHDPRAFTSIEAHNYVTLHTWDVTALTHSSYHN